MNPIERLRRLEPNWDGEGAPVPSSEIISKADEIIAWAKQNIVPIEDIDADVLGGIAIYLRIASNTLSWISF